MLTICSLTKVGAVSQSSSPAWLGCDEIDELRARSLTKSNKSGQKREHFQAQLDKDTIVHVKSSDQNHNSGLEQSISHYKNLRNHPNIVYTYGYCPETGTIVQEVLNPWRQESRIQNALTLTEKFQRVIDMASSLLILDSVNFVMCDFAPVQWAIHDNGVYKLLDLDTHKICTRNYASRYANKLELMVPEEIKASKGRHVWLIPEIIRFSIEAWPKHRPDNRVSKTTVRGFEKELEKLKQACQPMDLNELPALEDVVRELQRIMDDVLGSYKGHGTNEKNVIDEL